MFFFLNNLLYVFLEDEEVRVIYFKYYILEYLMK